MGIGDWGLGIGDWGLGPINEEFIHRVVTQRMVYLSCMSPRLNAVTDGGNPLPVAEMTQIEDVKRLSCVMAFLDFFKSTERHAAHNFLLRHGEHLDVLEEIVTQLMVEFLLDVLQFCLTLLREGTAQVLTYYLRAVKPPHEEADEVRISVKHGEWQDADGPKPSSEEFV